MTHRLREHYLDEPGIMSWRVDAEGDTSFLWLKTEAGAVPVNIHIQAAGSYTLQLKQDVL